MRSLLCLIVLHILEGLYDLISVESNRLLGIRIDSNRVDSSRFVRIFHLPAHLRTRKVHVIFLSFRVQILQIDNTSEGEGSLQFSCLVSHHALRTRKVHVIFLSFHVQILQIDNTSEEEGSLQCSCLVSHQ